MNALFRNLKVCWSTTRNPIVRFRFVTTSSCQTKMDPVDDGFPWHFRGEGNSSLVLSSEKTHTVLRLRKVLLDRPDASSRIEENNLQAIVNYVEHVIKPMVPCAGWIPKMKVVQLKDRFRELLETMKKERDPARLKDPQAFHTEAILMQDLAFLPDGYGIAAEMLDGDLTFSVEIKPKEGVLPTDPKAHPIRRKYSKYALKQLLKVHEGAIKTPNEYDPMDLFSGDKIRMHKALSSLINHPQNNLRVFVNGTLRFGSKNPGLESLGLLMGTFFPKGKDEADIVESFIELLVESLTGRSSVNGPSSDCLQYYSILRELLEVQRSCTVDVESLHEPLMRLYEKFHKNLNLRPSMGVDGPDFEKAPFWSGNGLDTLGFSPEEIQNLAQMRSYLATATLKDCSIFLTFRKVRETNGVVVKLPIIKLQEGLSFIFHASLVDLDPKPFERIERHYYEAKKLIEIAQNVGLHCD